MHEIVPDIERYVDRSERRRASESLRARVFDRHAVVSESLSKSRPLHSSSVGETDSYVRLAKHVCGQGEGG